MDPVTLGAAKAYTDAVALGEGAVPIPGPQGPPGEVTAQQLAAAVDPKLDKVTSTGGRRAYVVNPDGTQDTEIIVANTAAPYSVPERNENGTFAIGEPENPNEPATKKYVDENAGTDLSKGGVINGNLEINGNFILHGNETVDGNLLIGDKEVATRQFLLSVTPPRDAADRSGITMHVVNNGAATYSFFAGMDTLTETITIPPLDQFIIADTDDFPELGWYQGDPLIEVGTVLTIDFSGIVEQTVKIVVGDGMAIMNFDAENPLVLNAGSIFMFNKVLLLGSPEDAQSAAIQAAQAKTRHKSYTTCAGFLAELREKVAQAQRAVTQ